MQEEINGGGNFITYLLKVIGPAIAAAAINISVMIKTKKATFVGGVVSAVIALSTAYIVGDHVLSNYYEDSAIIIGGIVIVSEKVMMFVLTRFKWDVLFKRLVDTLFKLYGK